MIFTRLNTIIGTLAKKDIIKWNIHLMIFPRLPTIIGSWAKKDLMVGSWSTYDSFSSLVFIVRNGHWAAKRLQHQKPRPCLGLFPDAALTGRSQSPYCDMVQKLVCTDIANGTLVCADVAHGTPVCGDIANGVYVYAVSAWAWLRFDDNFGLGRGRENSQKTRQQKTHPVCMGVYFAHARADSLL